MKERKTIKRIDELLKKIRTEDDIVIIKTTCKHLYNEFKNSKFYKYYNIRISELKNYISTQDYCNDYLNLAYLLDSIIEEQYNIPFDYEMLYDIYLPIFNTILETEYENVNESEGIINYYISIFPTLNSQKFNKIFFDIDYWVFETLFNKNNKIKNYPIGNISTSSLKKLYKIISARLINDYLDTEQVTPKENHLQKPILTPKEKQIIKFIDKRFKEGKTEITIKEFIKELKINTNSGKPNFKLQKKSVQNYISKIKKYIENYKIEYYSVIEGYNIKNN